MQRHSQPARSAFQDPDITYGGIGPLAFYRQFAQENPQATEASTFPDVHICTETCPLWYRGNTFMCTVSGCIHECSTTQACSFATTYTDRNVCRLTGLGTPLDMDFKAVLFDSHHDHGSKKMRKAFASHEQSSHDVIDTEQCRQSADRNTLLLSYTRLCNALLNDWSPPGVWPVCLRLWRALSGNMPNRGQARDNCGNEHILTLFHMMSSEFALPNGHVIWPAHAELARRLPSRRDWRAMGVTTASRKVTKREAVIRRYITDYHRLANGCSFEVCELGLGV